MNLIQDFDAPSTITGKTIPDWKVFVSEIPASDGGYSEAGPDFYETETELVTSSGVWKNYSIVTELERASTITCINSDLAEVVDGVVVKVGNGGESRVRITSEGISKFHTINNRSTASTVKVLSGYKSGSMAKLLFDGIMDLLIEGKVAQVFSNYSQAFGATPQNLSRDSSCWLNAYDLSFCPIATDLYTPGTFGHWARGAVITSRHVIGAGHWNGGRGMQIGRKFRFRGNDGTAHERTVIGSSRGLGDIQILTLDSALPASVSTIPVVGEWIARNKIKNSANSGNFYSGGLYAYIDQNYTIRYLAGTTTLFPGVRPVETGDIYGVPFTDVHIHHDYSSLSTGDFFQGKTEFRKTPINGDSGSPVFVITPSGLALVGTWQSPTSHPAIFHDDGAILDVLIDAADADAEVSTGLTVTVATDPTL